MRESIYQIEASGTGVRREGPPLHALETLVDLHCHCLPGFDDGPESYGQAVALRRTLTQHSIRTVIATPHQSGGFEGRTAPDEIRIAVRRLNRRLGNEDINLTVFPGAEVRIDERISGLLAEDAILIFADMHRHIFLERPYEIFIDIKPLILQLRSQGIDPIIAHPERNTPLPRHQRILQRWSTCGVSLQGTAGSLTGDFGPQAEDTGWAWMAEGWVTVVATDVYGCRHKSLRMIETSEQIEACFGHDLARLLCVDNPSRVLRGEGLASPHIPARQEVR